LSVQEVGSLVRATSDVAEICSSEAVHCTIVTTNRDRVEDGSGHLNQFLGEGCWAVFIHNAENTAVLIIRDTFVIRLPAQNSICGIRDGEE